MEMYPLRRDYRPFDFREQAIVKYGSREKEKGEKNLIEGL
jgi:hypothetical protein